MLREQRIASLSTRLPSSALVLLVAERITHMSHRLMFTALNEALFKGLLCEKMEDDWFGFEGGGGIGVG